MDRQDHQCKGPVVKNLGQRIEKKSLGSLVRGKRNQIMLLLNKDNLAQLSHNSLIHSFNKYLLGTHYHAGTVLGVGDSEVKTNRKEGCLIKQLITSERQKLLTICEFIVFLPSISIKESANFHPLICS